jgi:hypothetical protein
MKDDIVILSIGVFIGMLLVSGIVAITTIPDQTSHVPEIIENTETKYSDEYWPKEGVPYISGPTIETQDYEPWMGVPTCWWTGDPDWPITCRTYTQPDTKFSDDVIKEIIRLHKANGGG